MREETLHVCVVRLHGIDTTHSIVSSIEVFQTETAIEEAAWSERFFQQLIEERKLPNISVSRYVISLQLNTWASGIFRALVESQGSEEESLKILQELLKNIERDTISEQTSRQAPKLMDTIRPSLLFYFGGCTERELSKEFLREAKALVLAPSKILHPDPIEEAIENPS